MLLKAVLTLYLATSLVAVALYAWDKRAARKGLRRTPERTLHSIELMGGWPGAIIARRALRHKTRKSGFLVVSWLIVAAHAAAWGVVLWAVSR